MFATWTTKFLETLEEEFPPLPRKHHGLFAAYGRLRMVFNHVDPALFIYLHDADESLSDPIASARHVAATIRAREVTL